MMLLYRDAILSATSPGCATALDAPTPSALVLTTHYMEECEALCERVGIMHKVCSGGPRQGLAGG